MLMSAKAFQTEHALLFVDTYLSLLFAIVHLSAPADLSPISFRGAVQQPCVPFQSSGILAMVKWYYIEPLGTCAGSYGSRQHPAVSCRLCSEIKGLWFAFALYNLICSIIPSFPFLADCPAVFLLLSRSVTGTN